MIRRLILPSTLLFLLTGGAAAESGSNTPIPMAQRAS
jgi:hypothetical protein